MSSLGTHQASAIRLSVSENARQPGHLCVALAGRLPGLIHGGVTKPGTGYKKIERTACGGRASELRGAKLPALAHHTWHSSSRLTEPNHHRRISMLMTAAILLAFFSIPPPLHVSAEGTPSPQPCDGVQGQLAVAGGEDSSPIDFQLRAVGRGGSGAVTTGSLFSSVGRDDAGHLQHELCLQNSKCYALSISGWGAPLDDGIEYSFADPHGAALSRCAPPMRVRCEYSSLVARARIVFYGDPPEKRKCLSINTNLVVMYPVARYPSFKQLPPLTRVLVFSRVYSARPRTTTVSRRRTSRFVSTQMERSYRRPSRSRTLVILPAR